MAEALNSNQTTEETVREVLGMTYDQWGFDEDAEQIANIVALLEDESKRTADTSLEQTSEAALEIRETLWNRYSGGGASASATCQLFLVLGRTDELGWIISEANGFKQWQQEMFLEKLAEVRSKTAK